MPNTDRRPTNAEAVAQAVAAWLLDEDSEALTTTLVAQGVLDEEEAVYVDTNATEHGFAGVQLEDETWLHILADGTVLFF